MAYSSESIVTRHVFVISSYCVEGVAFVNRNIILQDILPVKLQYIDLVDNIEGHLM